MRRFMIAIAAILMGGFSAFAADVEHELNENLANAAGLEATANYYLTRGEPEKAVKAERSLVALLRITSARYGQIATDALSSGHTLAGLSTNQKCNWVGPATPANLLGIALGLNDGTAYWNELVSQVSSIPAGSGPPEGDLHTFCTNMGGGMRSCNTTRY